jgi:hypothetical protein
MLRQVLIVLSAAALTFSGVVLVHSIDADTTWNGSNGYKIYLSPATHAPYSGSNPNYGCDSHNENYWAEQLGWTAAAGAGTDLVARGYSVRLGNSGYVTNKNSSNSWGADYHIPLHSNAPGSTSQWDCTAPYDLSYSASGTLLLYYPGSSGGAGMSDNLVYTVGGSSPGYGTDKKISSTCCTEITATNAYAAYLESGFHTFNPDQDWLQDEDSWGWRVGWGVDRYLGYP